MKNKIPKILGIGLSAGLVFGMIGALFAAPVSADLMKWGIVNTPSWEDLVIVPASDILDYDIGGDGDIVYAVLESNYDCNGVGGVYGDHPAALVKSEDGGKTWTDITSNVKDATNLPPYSANHWVSFVAVSVAPDDEDWVAVAGYQCGTGDPWVVASKDGGDNFSYTGDMVDGSSELDSIFDIDVSIEVDGIHNIAVAGEAGITDADDATVYRLKAGTWLSAAWEDTSAYDGWPPSGLVQAAGVIACEFSPNFDIDDTIVCMYVDDSVDGDKGYPYVISGIWESGGGAWADEAGFPSPVQITADGDTLLTGVYWRSLGFALPDDYDGSDPGARVIYAYANAYNDTTNLVGGFLVRIDNSSVSEPFGPSGEPLLASIDFHGEADTGKMMIGEYIDWDNDASSTWLDEGDYDEADCCEGVKVWHTVELDPCCPNWEVACKNPSGFYTALVRYTPDGNKAYATTSGSADEDMDDWSGFGGYDNASGIPDTFFENLGRKGKGTPLDESAFSVSLDDGISFNQIGLIDTDVDYLSDVAVCPDCGTIYMSTINEYAAEGSYPCLSSEHDCGQDFGAGYCNCDSVWRSYDNGDTWERILHGNWVDGGEDELLLRLPCDAVEDCCDQDPVAPSGTLYLGIKNYNNPPDMPALRTIFYTRDCGQCWNEPPATKIDIQDIAVESENIVYVIDDEGMFSMSTQYGRRWSDAVDTGLDSGHTIAACCEEGLVVVGGDGDEPVAWSDDGGESWNLTDDLPGSADYNVHVACDPICENIIYAAISGPVYVCGGIYRSDTTTGTWENLDAFKYGYYGIAIGRSDGTLYAVSNNIHVDPDADICDRFVVPEENSQNNENGDHYYEVYSGVARNLTPCETDCCGTEDWDYLICGLGTECIENKGIHCEPTEWFNGEPSDLKICGCTSIATNTILWAIDTQPYDATDGAGNNDSCGSLWSYEDCAAKMGPVLTAPADGTVIDCEPCAGCDASAFTLKWERMCEACSYDVQIMDEDGNLIVEWVDVDITGDPPSLFVDGTAEYDSMSVDFALECGMNYTWKVREANTSCECVHSPWSETWSFTVAVGAADAIQLLAPTKGAMDVPVNNIGFSWSSVRNASSYSFVLSPNANLTGALVSQDMSTTAFNFVGPLDYSKAYYWQVIAWQDGTRLTTSSIGVFNTMAQPVAPQPPVVVEEQPAPVINIPPAEKITPTWIYAIIGIGCALAVVVIVLIVRTRRP